MSTESGKDISRHSPNSFGISSSDRYLTDEATRAAIRGLPIEVTNEICHVVLTGLCIIAAKHRLGLSLDRAIIDFETKFKELML